VVVTHVEAVEGNRKHVMRLRIACVGSMNHLLNPTCPYPPARVLYIANVHKVRFFRLQLPRCM
jgi:hypothetical protein